MRRGFVRTWLSPLWGLRSVLDVEMDPGAKQEFVLGSTMACDSYTSVRLACTEAYAFRKLSGNSGAELWALACLLCLALTSTVLQVRRPALQPPLLLTPLGSHHTEPLHLHPSTLQPCHRRWGTGPEVQPWCPEVMLIAAGYLWGSPTPGSEWTFSSASFLFPNETSGCSGALFLPNLTFIDWLCLSCKNQWFKTEACAGAHLVCEHPLGKSDDCPWASDCVHAVHLCMASPIGQVSLWSGC